MKIDLSCNHKIVKILKVLLEKRENSYVIVRCSNRLSILSFYVRKIPNPFSKMNYLKLRYVSFREGKRGGRGGGEREY